MKNFKQAAKVSAARKIKCYATGGRVDDEALDDEAGGMGASAISRPRDIEVDGGKSRKRLDKPGKAQTSVNIVVMSGKEKQPSPIMGANPMPPPPAPPPPVMPQAGMGVPPPGLPGRKRGGRVMAKGEGSGTGLGRLAKIKDCGAKAGKPAKGQ